MRIARHIADRHRKHKIVRRSYRNNRADILREQRNAKNVALSDIDASGVANEALSVEPVPEVQLPPRSPWRRRFIVASVIVGLSAAGYYEMKNSHIQAYVLADFARGISYSLEPGPAPQGEITYPERGPFDVRMGYSAMPKYLSILTDKNYEIESQARWSTSLTLSQEWGLFPIYREKTRAGLVITDRHDELIYGDRYPRYTYSKFEDISPLIVNTLLFIENRELLDENHPQRNPAIEWDRMLRVTGDLVLNMVRQDDEKLAGGSTLATQIEKYRHSPDGITESPIDKVKQMASASLRTYMDGENTFAARQRIVLDYINTVPLAARGSYGEVHGIGDGLSVWYDADFNKVDDLLSQPVAMGSELLTEQALAYKQVLSLFLAQRRPSYYLASSGGEPRRLNELVDVYLELMADAGVITHTLKDVALQVKLEYGPTLSERGSLPFVADKAVNVTRTRLAGALGLESLYDLDRLDLSVRSTFDKNMQRIATEKLRDMQNPDAVRKAGLYGDRLFKENNDLSKVVYSLTLIERTPEANLVRIQADNLDQPFDINDGVKLDLGSTAKLRTMVSYLNVIADLHKKYASFSLDELEAIDVEDNNVLTRWAVDYLRTTAERGLPEMLAASMERRYSANPRERFFTGGGVHTFNNFDREDNGKVLTVRESFRNSVNLPFVRMMRDIVRYHMLNVPGSAAKLIEDVNDERREAYLARFADQEGSAFMLRFYRKYKDKSSQQMRELLLNSTRLTPQRLAMIYTSTAANPNFIEFNQVLRDRLPGSVLSERDIDAIYKKYTPERYNLPDQGYIARIHPLELWTAAYLMRNPLAQASEVLAASAEQRQEVYSWLRKTRHKNAQDNRIRQLLEMEAFLEIHKEWKRLGYPFDSLVASYATSIGSSADRPAALAELMGILLNDGVRLPSVRIAELHFAEDTPYETLVKRKLEKGEQVIDAAVAVEVRKALQDVVENGTGRRMNKIFSDAEGNPIVVGGKTGTGDHRRDIYGRGGVLKESTVMNRTAVFVFYIGERYYGTITAFVPGTQAKNYQFTSGLPVQLLKVLSPQLAPYLYPVELPAHEDLLNLGETADALSSESLH